MTLRSPQAIWEAALGELELQVSRPNYDTWLKDTRGISYRDDLFVIGVPNVFVAEWLGNRLYSLIKRTLAGIAGKHLDIQFLVQTPSEPDTHLAHARQADGGTSSPSKQLSRASNLNLKYTFNTFVTGEPNRLAYATALAVAEGTGLTYNPLFIYGDTGVGKTHLLQAIGHVLKASRPRVVYASAEQFTSQFVAAVKNKQTDQFQDRFRSCDVLLVDDIHFLSGKTQTQECFFHIFNHLYDNGCQIVVTSDSPPKAISSLTKRLRSRLECGLVVDMRPPDLETRLNILGMKSKPLNISIPSEVLHFLATQFQHNVRELEGALNRLVTYARLSGGSIDTHVVRHAVRDLLPKDPGRETVPTPRQVIDAVAGYYGLTPAALTGKRRDQPTALARQVAMFLLRERNNCSLAEIGHLLGGRDHTTVLHGSEKIAARVRTNAELSKSVAQISHYLTSGEQAA